MIKKDIFVLPGTIQRVKNYGYDGLDIWMKDEVLSTTCAKIFIGHSLGASFILKSNVNRDSKFILVNPLIIKKCFAAHFLNWIKFLVFEGFAINKAVPARCWWHTFKQILSLLKVDVFKEIKNIPKENIFIIKGKYDCYFCDRKSAEILKNDNFNVIEVEAGHDWNENIASVVKNIIKTF
ncbi:MAG: hypothetical protein ACD_56C00036G0002 [uncultured bacterium]|nr:MAG: hypothetical protein ACD_56C00036G0002 [uncultured bacterium]